MLNTLKKSMVLAFLCLTPSFAAYAALAYYSAETQDDILTISGTVLYAQDTPYVSLGDLLHSLGGALQITSEQCQANYLSKTALLKPDTVAVATPGLTFSLIYPVRLHEGDLFLAQTDVADFFARVYQTHVFKTEQAVASPAAQEEPPLDENPGSLLEVMPLPSPEAETPDEKAEALLEEVATPEPESAEGEDVAEGESTVDSEPKTTAVSDTRGVILLDPGHGGKDPGATASDTVTEKNVTLSILMKLRSVLKETTALTIHLSRDADVDIPQSTRAKAANAAACDLLISIHTGYSATPRTDGVTLFTDQLPAPPSAKASIETRQNYTRRRSYGEQAATIAYHIAKTLAEEKTLGPVTMRTAPLIIQRLSEMPSILIEVAYLNNPGVVASITEEDYQMRIAESLGRAINAAMSQASP